jgi:nucleotide-binding universal stress UspA family protein
VKNGANTLLSPNVERVNVSRDRHILLALDETKNSMRALLYVADFLGGQSGIRVTLLRIIPDPSEDYFENDYERAEWLENQCREIDEMMRKYREILVQAGFRKKSIGIRVIINYCTSIAECILEEQKNLDCCTVVVGRRVLSRKEEFLFGSTSCNILHAPKKCAIWVIE